MSTPAERIRRDQLPFVGRTGRWVVRTPAAVLGLNIGFLRLGLIGSLEEEPNKV